MPDSTDNPTDLDQQIVKSKQAVVYAKEGGRVMANSRDVARLFSKRHDNVMRDIATLQVATGGALNFEETPYVDPQNGQTYPSFDMDRDAFTMLAMGFTGAAAVRFKLDYIAAFNAMETSLREPRDVTAALADPATLQSLLLANVSKVLELQAKVASDAPKVEALDRLVTADGSLCVTDAAKTLGVRPKALFESLRSHGWIYSPPGGRGDIAYAVTLQRGLMEHKTTTVHRSDGSEKIITQARITPKGLARLAQEFPPPAIAA